MSLHSVIKARGKRIYWYGDRLEIFDKKTDVHHVIRYDQIDGVQLKEIIKPRWDGLIAGLATLFLTVEGRQYRLYGMRWLTAQQLYKKIAATDPETIEAKSSKAVRCLANVGCMEINAKLGTVEYTGELYGELVKMLSAYETKMLDVAASKLEGVKLEADMYTVAKARWTPILYSLASLVFAGSAVLYSL